MTFAKPRRSAKLVLNCSSCKTPNPPAMGDWFVLPQSEGEQVFLCKACGLRARSDVRMAMGRNFVSASAATATAVRA